MGKYLPIAISAIFMAIAMSKLILAEMQCQGQDMKHSPEQVEQMKDCLNYSGTTSVWKLKPSEFPCFGTCLFKIRGFMSEDGEYVVKERMVAHLTKVVPAEHLKPLLDGVTGCIDKSGKNLGTKTDKTCMKFMQLGQCLHDTMMDVCI